MDWRFEKLAGPYGGVTEGPVWTGDALLFTHIQASRILRFDPRKGEVTEYITGTDRTNGLCFDGQGRLYGCSGGGRCILRFEAGGRMTRLPDRLDGKRHNNPNDLAIDRQGRIWFTDPWGNANDKSGMELDHESVLRLDPQPGGGWTLRRLTFDTTHPNGILISPDNRTLYVAESDYGVDRKRELRAYPIKDDGTLGPYITLHTFGLDHRGVHRGVDGMTLDQDGNIIACAGWEISGPGPMLYVFSPTGRVLETHPIPTRRPTNCCFGDADMQTLYVTTIDGELFRTRTNRRGWTMWPTG